MQRNDGEFLFYRIQHQNDSGKCVFSTFDYFHVDDPHYREFTACGSCWQTTGEHGTENEESAKAVAVAMTTKYERAFRVVQVEISQKTTPVFTSSPF